MERKIGEIFEYNGEWYQCIVGNGCKNCAFNERKCYTFTDNNDPIGDCCAERRTDKYSVIFKKLEKVGEPYEFDGHLFQSYRTFEVPIFTENYATVRELGNNSKISIEIKQIKEDMEENENNRTNCEECGDKRFEVIARAKAHLLKATNIASDEKEMAVIDNILFRFYQMGWLERYEEKTEKLDLKPFNLEAAKSGKPVCTRDGRKARIICFDAKKDMPLVALITNKDIVENKIGDTEEVHFYYEDGRCNKYQEYCYDLMMSPEKKEGWVNIVRGSNGSPHMGRGIFQSKEEAENATKAFSDNLIDTVKISWEE